MTDLAVASSAARKFVPSLLQSACFDWILNGKGSAIWKAVAGSGKSTAIVRSLEFIPESASVAILAFNAPVAKEMVAKIEKLGLELGRAFRNVRGQTFHKLGYGSVLKKLGKTPREVEPNEKKLSQLFRASEGDETVELYEQFVCHLVGLAKGEGFGAIRAADVGDWAALIAHHDLYLDSEDASEEVAIELARKLLRASNEAARNGLIDFDDMIYLPLLWKLRLWQNDFVFIDEAQDTNPARRALAKLALRPGGRLIAVGDPHQAIYGFTGASHDALDLIAREFRAVEMPLTVSYRCPRAAEAEVREILPSIDFSVHERAIDGRVSHLSERQGVARLGAGDFVICRNVAPLITLAFSLIASGRPAVVRGKEIGSGLTSLVKKQRARGIENLVEKLLAFREREVAKFTARGEEEKAEGVSDRVECVLQIVGSIPEGADRTVPALLARIDGMFADQANAIQLMSAHKSKGLEAPRVAILRPDLMPSKWARQEHQAVQEMNLMYVARTRFQEELIYLDGPETPEERQVMPPSAGGRS